MIQIALPAVMTCVEGDCGATQPVKLCLMASGGFGFKPESLDWQVLTQPHTPGGPFLAFCPAHKRDTKLIQTQVGPAGKRLFTREEH